jgi:RNA polymerase sigma-70 factor (ECF subfamily)
LQYEPHDTDTPERMFDRRWAAAILTQVLGRLEQNWEHAGKGVEFAKLKACLTGDADRGIYEKLGQQLGTTEGAVKVAVHRLRRDFRRTLREEIGHTVDSETAVDDEIAYLFRVLRS